MKDQSKLLIDTQILFDNIADQILSIDEKYIGIEFRDYIVKLIFLEGLHLDLLSHGDKEFSWQRAYDLGLFSKYTLKLFAKELEDAKVDMSNRKYYGEF